MTIEALIAQLKELPQDLEVVEPPREDYYKQIYTARPHITTVLSTGVPEKYAIDYGLKMDKEKRVTVVMI